MAIQEPYAELSIPLLACPCLKNILPPPTPIPIYKTSFRYVLNFFYGRLRRTAPSSLFLPRLLMPNLGRTVLQQILQILVANALASSKSNRREDSLPYPKQDRLHVNRMLVGALACGIRLSRVRD